MRVPVLFVATADSMDPAASLPDAETIRRTADEVLARPEFQAEPLGDSGATIWDLFLRALAWLITPFRWLFNALEGIPDVLRWSIVVGLALALVALISHITYTIVTVVRGSNPSHKKFTLETQRPPDPADLERQSREAAARQDYIGAVRLLFRACLLRLEEAEKRKIRAGTTNRELLRKHKSSLAYRPMKQFVDTIEWKWYGLGECGAEDYEVCRTAHGEILRVAGSGADAHGA